MAQSYKLLPNLVKHMTVAIYRAGRVKGGSWQERYYNAWTIARTRLVAYGYLKPGSESGPVTNVIATAKGAAKSKVHNNDNQNIKAHTFDKLAWILEQRDNPPKDDKPVESTNPEVKQSFVDMRLQAREKIVKPGDPVVFNREIYRKIQQRRTLSERKDTPEMHKNEAPPSIPYTKAPKQKKTIDWKKLYKRNK